METDLCLKDCLEDNLISPSSWNSARGCCWTEWICFLLE